MQELRIANFMTFPIQFSPKIVNYTKKNLLGGECAWCTHSQSTGDNLKQLTKKNLQTLLKLLNIKNSISDHYLIQII